MIPKMTLNNIRFNLISNNVEGLQISKKYLKLFEDFKDKIFPNGIVFLREKSSIRENEIQWKNNFRGNFCFSHVVQTLVLIAFFGTKRFTVKKKTEYRNRRILILEALHDGSEFILINFCNANTECMNNLKLF